MVSDLFYFSISVYNWPMNSNVFYYSLINPSLACTNIFCFFILNRQCLSFWKLSKPSLAVASDVLYVDSVILLFHYELVVFQDKVQFFSVILHL